MMIEIAKIIFIRYICIFQRYNLIDLISNTWCYLQNNTKPFIVNPNTGEVVIPKLLSTDPPLMMSMPITDKTAKSSIVKMPVTSNGYVTHTVFTVSISL